MAGARITQRVNQERHVGSTGKITASLIRYIWGMTQDEYDNLAPGDRVYVAPCDDHHPDMRVYWGRQVTVLRKEYIVVPFGPPVWNWLVYDHNNPLGLEIIARPQDIDLPIGWRRAKDPHYPHTCPKCKGPAYMGVVPTSFECKKGCS